jgi:hypothetical protein
MKALRRPRAGVRFAPFLDNGAVSPLPESGPYIGPEAFLAWSRLLRSPPTVLTEGCRRTSVDHAQQGGL